MKENYSYPLDAEWSTNEIVTVMDFWQKLEMAYEKGVPVADFLKAYDGFKKVVPAIGEERRLGREFEELTNYSLYQTVKVARASSNKMLKMKDSN